MARRVLVTGGTGTIGRAICETLAAADWSVIVLARDEDRIREVLKNLRGSGHIGLSLDVADPLDWEVDLRNEDVDSLQGLVTAAASYGPIGSLHTLDSCELADTIAVNLVGTLLSLHHAMPLLIRGEGRVVTFSGAGGSALPRYDAYVASKAAVARLTENVAEDGLVEANCVAPGFIASKIHDATLSAGPEIAGKMYASTQERLSAGGQSLDRVTSLVSFLLSSDSIGITGRTISAQWDPWDEQDFQQRLRTEPTLGKFRRQER